MKYLMILVAVLALALSSCTSNDTAVNAGRQVGFRNVGVEQQHDVLNNLYGCPEGTAFSMSGTRGGRQCHEFWLCCQIHYWHRTAFSAGLHRFSRGVVLRASPPFGGAFIFLYLALN